MIMQPLWFGTETEYAFSLGAGADHYPIGAVAARCIGCARPAWRGGANRWSSRHGGRFYIDVGMHPEACTPSASTGRRVVIHERSMEAEMLADITEAEQLLDMQHPIFLAKNNTAAEGDGNETTYGYHENYLASRRVSRHDIARLLAPFFVTRQIVGGSGSVVRDDRTGAWHYELAQRSRHIHKLYNGSATYNRGLIKDRDQALADPQHYQRLEVVFGDANILFWPAAAKLDMTALLVRMADLGYPVPDLALEDPIEAMHDVARHGALIRLRLVGGKTVRPVDVQLAYLAAVMAFVLEHELTEYLPSLGYWAKVLAALATSQHDQLVGLVDWATKEDKLAQAADRKGSRLTADQAACFSRRYHTLAGDKNWPQAFRAKYDPSDLAEQVQLLGGEPPNWRAALRAQAAAMFEDPALDEIVGITWDWIGIGRPPYQQRLALKDPFRPLPIADLSFPEVVQSAA
jgi:proteasome accessory factor A